MVVVIFRSKATLFQEALVSPPWGHRTRAK
jgi:hypothetical protein